MKVGEWMERKLITIDRKTTIQRAILLMKKHSIRHLPVIDEGRLVGLVTEGDMRQVFVASLIEELSIDDVMIKDPVTVKSDAEIDDAARLIYYNKIGGLPVVDEDQRLLGIITVADIMAAFIELMGVLKSSSRIDVVLGQDPEAFEEVSRIISSKGGKIISVGMLPQSDRKENIYFFRLKKRRIGKIVDALGEAGYTVIASME
ncbi:MAG: CBS domain-containing protein [Desulfobacterales bacterium]|nr:CBS domain-containing protein [Desulfobacterales bacterium]